MSRFHSIRWRLVASYLLLSALIVILVGVIALALVSVNARKRETGYLTAYARAIAEQAYPLLVSGAPAGEIENLTARFAQAGDVQVTITDYQEEVLAQSGPPSAQDRLALVMIQEAQTGPNQFSVRPAEEGMRETESFYSEAAGAAVPIREQLTIAEPPRSARSAVLPIGDAGAPLGFVSVSQPPDFVSQEVRNAVEPVAIAAGAAGLAAILLGLLMAKYLTAHLEGLMAAADGMSAGNLSIRAPVSSRDEFGRLAQQFNQMAEKLEASFAALKKERDTLRRFVSDASHELRTPITALKTFNELLTGPAAEDPPARQEFLQESQVQIARLEWVTRNLLDLSRLEAGAAALKLEACLAKDLLESAWRAFKPLAAEKGIALTLCLSEANPAVECDRAWVGLAISNLIGNALKFTPTGGQVVAGLEAHPDGVRFWVQDNGPGIADADQPHVFDRFYRGRGTTVEGSGLGLAIVQSVVKAHGGRVWLVSRPGEGSLFTIELPVSPAAEAGAGP